MTTRTPYAHIWPRLWLALTTATVIPACGAGSIDGAGGSTVCDAPNTTFKNTCGQIGCHSTPGTGIPPDLASAGQWNRLVSQMATQSTGGLLGQSCIGMILVNPQKPASGVLFKRLTGTSCGDQMPYGVMATDQPSLDCITSWVNSQLPP